jgi:hypothetical protein
MDERLNIFKTYILDSLNDDYDEVLLIAHSNGTILSVPLLNDIFNETTDIQKQKFRFLSFGHCIPLASFYRKSHKFLNQLDELSQKNFIWYDIGSPADGVCFALHNPFISYNKAILGKNNDPQPIEHIAKIQMFTPQFHKYYEKNNYQKLKKNKFLLHFQYMYCSDKPSPYNFYRLITHYKTLEENLILKVP